MTHKIVEAVAIAVPEAEKCGLDMDVVELAVSIEGDRYKIEFSSPGKRGGGAVIVVDRAATKVQSALCLQ